MIYKTKMGFIRTREYKIATAALCCNHFLIQDPAIFIYVTFTVLVHNKIILIIDLQSCSKRMKSSNVKKQMKQLIIKCTLDVCLGSTCN